MNVHQENESNGVRTLDVIMTGLAVMLLAGNLLLVSVAEPVTTPDGAIEWQAESPLRAVVEVLCLNYRMPTDSPTAVKGLAFGVSAALAIMAIAVAAVVRGRTAMANGVPSVSSAELSDDLHEDASDAKSRAHVAPLLAAQVLVVLYLLWSFASSRWSLAPLLAIGGSILLTIHFLWAFCLGHGLSTHGAIWIAKAMLAALAITATVAIWYHYGRNPTLRADFPVGNPGFLGACLIPGILLAGAMAAAHAPRALQWRQGTSIGVLGLSLVAMAIQLWALVLADSRAAYAALAVGVVAMLFFWFPGRTKWIAVMLAVVLAVAGIVYVAQRAEAFSPTGRGASLRLRFYAWRYAWEMFTERPLTGHGQGGFALVGDTHAINDVLRDPPVFESRITHAHNEWLEVMADLGSVGIVLIATALLFTFRAALGPLASSSDRRDRWVQIALLGSLVALVVEECFNVGLRIPGIGAVFYTLLGLVWAFSAHGESHLVQRIAATRTRQWMTSIFGCLAGLVVLALVRDDFASARDVYRARQALTRGEYTEAAEFAQRATNRLSPQRALTSLYRLSEAHLRIAQDLQRRGLDRQRRADETQPPDHRLLSLAHEDLRRSDEHCETGSAALKELVLRAPEFINHGRLRYWLNLTRARNAAARHDSARQQALLADAVVAIRRELRRQPFDPAIAVDFARLAGSASHPLELLEILARPLRYHRMTPEYMDILRGLTSNSEAAQRFRAAIQEAVGDLQPPAARPSVTNALQQWRPEVRRIEAAVDFLHGRYGPARDALLTAAPAYKTLGVPPTVGSASCYAELAICQFYSSPEDPTAALDSAETALSMAPRSRLGRELQHAIQQRRIEFFLAAGKEEEARQILIDTAPRGVTEADVSAELGQRYLRLCEALLDRSGTGPELRQPPAQLAGKLREWARRAVDLSPNDPNSEYVAADLALYLDDEQAAALHLQKALRKGLPLRVAQEFLSLALERKPGNKALEALRQELATAGTSEQSSPPSNGPPSDLRTPSETPNDNGAPESLDLWNDGH